MKILRYLSKIKTKKRTTLDLNRPEIGAKRSQTKVKCVRFSVPFEAVRKPTGPLLKEIKCLRRATRHDLVYKGNFLEAMAPVLLMAQCFAIMPVCGVRGDTAADLRFSWKALRSIYSIITFTLTTIQASLAVFVAFRNKVEFDLVVPMVFYASVVYGMLCFFCLAMKWPELMRKWEKIENELPKMQTINEKRKLADKVKMVTLVMMTLSLSEHILNIISIVHYATQCPSEHKDPIKDFFMANLNQLFQFTAYAPWKAFVGKCLNVICTFIWSYMDVFVMVVSIGLSNRFELLNDDLMRIKSENMTQEFWSIRRKQYRSLCKLCEIVDDAISKITVVSFSNNLFFICVQLLRSLKPMPSFAHAFYFWFSLIFLIGRTLTVCMYAAHVYEQSKLPIHVLRAVPNDSWCLDVQRFSEEVVNHTAALSGMRFFYLTRGLVLSVAGTIATYELVLIQFNQGEELEPETC